MSAPEGRCKVIEESFGLEYDVHLLVRTQVQSDVARCEKSARAGLRRRVGRQT